MRAVGHGAGAEPLRLSMGGPTVHMGWGPGRGVEGTTSGPGVLRVCEQPPRSCLRLGSTGRPRGPLSAGQSRPGLGTAAGHRGRGPGRAVARGLRFLWRLERRVVRVERRTQAGQRTGGGGCLQGQAGGASSGPHRPHSGSWQGAATPHRSEAAGTRARTGSGPELQVPG